MSRNGIALALVVVCVASPAWGASLEKAKALYQNNFLDEAKHELIEVIYAAESSDAEKSLALYMMGLINEKQGNSEVAASSWRELLTRFPQAAEASLAREALNRSASTTGKQATVAPPRRADGGSTPGMLEVRQGSPSDLSHPVRTEVPNPMVIQATVPAVKVGLRDKTVTMDIKGTDLYVCDKAHVSRLTVSRRPRPHGGNPRRAMLDEVNAWPRGAAMVYLVTPTIATDWFRQDIDLTITATTQSGEALATRTWDDLTIGADNAASKMGVWGSSSTKRPTLIVPMAETQVDRFEAEPFLLKIVIEI